MAAPPKFPPTATVPRPLSIDQALHQSEPLARLGERLRDSAARLAAIVPVLPAPLVPHVKAGPVDDTGWTLLAANPAVAAKLRQLVPTIDTTLQAKGWQATAIRVRIQSTGV
jgi:hypothetical protein